MDNKSTIQLDINCTSDEIANIILKSLEPENKFLEGDTQITSTVTGNILSIKIESVSKLSSLRYTIDDILHTITVIESTYNAVMK